MLSCRGNLYSNFFFLCVYTTVMFLFLYIYAFSFLLLLLYGNNYRDTVLLVFFYILTKINKFSVCSLLSLLKKNTVFIRYKYTIYVQIHKKHIEEKLKNYSMIRFSLGYSFVFINDTCCLFFFSSELVLRPISSNEQNRERKKKRRKAN
jgi:archaellum biogenesis protein FlaJ (TadC family)